MRISIITNINMVNGVSGHTSVECNFNTIDENPEICIRDYIMAITKILDFDH